MFRRMNGERVSKVLGFQDDHPIFKSFIYIPSSPHEFTATNHNKKYSLSIETIITQSRLFAPITRDPHQQAPSKKYSFQKTQSVIHKTHD